MKSQIQLFLVSLIMLALSSCAFQDGEGTREQTARDLKERDLILQSLNEVKGTYIGRLQDGIRNEPIELTFFIQDEATGQRDSQGRPLTRPMLFARLRTTDIVRYDSRFTARYYQESGELLLFAIPNQPNNSPYLQPMSSVQGRFSVLSGIYSGEVVGPSGQLGTLEATRSTREVLLPGINDELEINERLRRQFLVITGTWEGLLDDGVKKETVRLILFVQEERVGSGSQGEVLTRPILVSRFSTVDSVRFDATYSVRYRPEISEIILLNNNVELQNINGRFSAEGSFIGIASTSRGTLGTLTLHRTSTETPAPGSEEQERNDRLRRQLETVKGTWEGLLINGLRQDPIRLVLFIQEEQAGSNPQGEVMTRPVLYGRFRTLEMIRHDIVFSTRYRPENNELLLLNATAEIQNISGSFSSPNHFSGTVGTSSGTLGTLQLRRISQETPAPGQGEENERNERIRRMLEPLVGSYIGNLTNLSNPNRPERNGIQVELFIASQNSPNGLVPVLLGKYSIVDGLAGDLSFAVTYKPELTPAQIIMTSQGVVTRPGNYFVTLEGELQADGSIRGKHFTQMGLTGQFELRKRLP